MIEIKVPPVRLGIVAQMQVNLGKTLAHCQACGGTDFAVADPGTEDADVCEVICTTCERATTYGALILQIGSEALHDAWQQLAASRH